MPRSFSNLARPRPVENVEHELRRERDKGVGATLLARLLAAVDILLPAMLQT